VLLVPVVLLILIVTFAVTRAVAAWPGQQLEGWVLLAIVALSLLPVILLLIQILAARGGTIAVAGLSLSFVQVSEKVASSIRVATLAENLDTSGDIPVTGSSLRSIMRALRRAHDSEVTVVDLRQGRTWWETRLFILIAAAARRTSPAAIAFIGDRNGRPGAYLGWATPSRLLSLHMSADPSLSEAYGRAAGLAAQWQIGTPMARLPGGTPSVKLPWNNQVFALPSIAEESPDPAFALELFLQQELDTRPEATQQFVSVQRLLELYEPILMTDRVDTDAADATWAHVLALSPRRYFALTNAGTFKALVPRDSLLATLMVRMVESENEA
jgi:hypothetical protein